MRDGRPSRRGTKAAVSRPWRAAQLVLGYWATRWEGPVPVSVTVPLKRRRPTMAVQKGNPRASSPSCRRPVGGLAQCAHQLRGERVADARSDFTRRKPAALILRSERQRARLSYSDINSSARGRGSSPGP